MSTPTEAKRRGQAVAGGLAGVAVVAVLIAVFVGIKVSDDDKPAAPAAAPAPSQPAAAPPSADAPAPTQPAPAPVDTPPALAKAPVVKGGAGTLAALKVTPLVKGTGPEVKAGETITVNYVLVEYKTGKAVESSFDGGQPYSTPIGVNRVIKGWDQGLPGQKVGSRVQLDVPAALAYGPGTPDLRFVVDLLA
jgi:peptidylprolyl isomerase